MLSPDDVARAWGVSAGHIRRLCQRGELAAMKTGTGPRAVWRIRPEAVAEFEAAHANQPEARPELATVAWADARTDPLYTAVVPGVVPWRSEVTQKSRTRG